MNKVLKFAVDSIEEINAEVDSAYEQAKKSRFAKVKIRLFGTGENAHTAPVDFETLKSSADSAYDIPLIAELNPYRSNTDFGGHGVLTGSEFSFGFIKEDKDNPIVYEEDEQGKIFLTLYGLIWRKYFSNIVDILMDRNNKTEVSVELESLGETEYIDKKPVLQQFVLNAVTFLGQVTKAACKGANAELCFSEDSNLEFLKDKEEYLQLNFSETIEIDNSKESAVSGSWSNPRLKLLTPIVKASNRKALLKEAYLFCSDTSEDVNLSDVSYPHHVIRNNKLILHIRGVQAAFSRLAQQGKVTGDAKAHLLRHYRELGLTTENFAEFGLTQEQFEQYFAQDLRKEEEKSMEMEEIKEEAKEEEFSEEPKNEGEEEKEEETFATEEEKENEEKEEEIVEEESCEGENEENTMSSDNGIPPEPPLPTYEEVIAENNKLKLENEAYMSQIAEMCDYNDLKEFKESTLKKQAEELEMSEMTKVITSLTEKGIAMSEELKTELFEKRQEFSNITAWSNYVKAYAFDNCEISGTEGIVKMEILSHKENPTNTWEALRAKYIN